MDARARAARRRTPLAFAPGQFTMLSAFGTGEVPISISGDPGGDGPLVHTVRAVGLATQAICDARPGRGPRACAARSAVRGRCAEIEGADVLVVAGGIGLAPLRPAILALLARRERYGRLLLLYGGRSPEQLLYRGRARASGRSAGWRWRSPSTAPARSGSGTSASSRGSCAARRFDPAGAVALLCGPEVMMRFTVAALAQRRRRRRARVRVDGAQHAVRDRSLRALPARADARLPRRAGLPLERARAVAGDPGAVMADRRTRRSRQQTLAVWKFASCDGCQLSLLDCEDELLALADRARDRLLPGGQQRDRRRARTTSRSSRARSPRAHDAERIHEVRAQLARADHDRRVRHRRRHPGAAQLRRRRGLHARSCTPRRTTSRTLAHLHADQRARARRLRAATAARSTSTSCSR